MSARTRGDLSVIPTGESIVLDSSTMIAYLGGMEAASPAAARLFDGMVRPGRNPGVVSTISVAEVMVRPLATGLEAASSVTAFLLSFPGLAVRSVDFLVAAEAARIRALTRASTPDSLIAATATLTGSRWLVTNDGALRDCLSSFDWDTTVLVLGEAA